MKKIPLHEYARLKKKSIFAVVKDIQGGNLESVEEEINGVKKRYVLIADEQESKNENISSKIKASNINYENEIRELKSEIRELKELLRECCQRLEDNK